MGDLMKACLKKGAEAKALKYYVCRVKAYQSGWTIEAFPCGSGGWWFKVYDAYSGDEAPTPCVRCKTFKAALKAGAEVAKVARLPQQTIDYNSARI